MIYSEFDILQVNNITFEDIYFILVSVHWRTAVGRKLAEANDSGFLNIF